MHSITPLDFPAILSKYLYKSSKHEGRLLCDEKYYKLASKQGLVKVKGTPGTKLTCSVFIYVSPNYCKIWNHIAHAEVEDSSRWQDPITPKSQIDLSVAVPSWSHETTGMRSGRYIVIIARKILSESPIALSLLRHLAAQNAPISFGTKLLIVIEGDFDASFISEAFLVLPPSAEADNYWIDVINCMPGLIGALCRWKAVLKRKYIFKKPDKFKTRDELDSYVYHHFQSNTKIWLFSCFICPSSEYRVLSYGELNLKTRKDWRGSPIVQFIQFNLLFPNSTIFPKEGDYEDDFTSPFFQIIQMNTAFYFQNSKATYQYFVTCYEDKKIGALSLKGYVSAYDYPTWISIGLFSIVTSLVFLRTSRQGSLLLFLFILVEQGCVDSVSKRFRLIMGIWVIMGVILSNAYKGDNITELTAPLPQFRWELLDQLIAHHFSYYRHINLLMLMEKYWEYDKFEYLGKDVVEERVDNLIELMLDMEYYQFMQISLKSNSSRIDAVLQGTIHLNSSFGKSENISDMNQFLRLFAKCDKQAYIGPYQSVLQVSLRLSKILSASGKSGSVQRSKEALNWTTIRWDLRFIPIPASRLFIRYNTIWQSGLPQMWDDWFLRVSTLIERLDAAHSLYLDSQPKKLTLKDNVVVIFMLYSTLTFSLSLAFISELRHHIFVACFNYVGKLFLL